MLWTSGESDLVMVQKNTGSNPDMSQLRSGELSLSTAVNGYPFWLREGYDSKRRGMGSAFHILTPRYCGPLTTTALTATRLSETYTCFSKVVITKDHIKCLMSSIDEVVNSAEGLTVYVCGSCNDRLLDKLHSLSMLVNRPNLVSAP